MSAIGLYTGQYIWGANKYLRPNPVRRWKPALLLRSAHCSNVRRHRSLQVLKVSGSKIELEFCAAGSNTVPVYVWLLPVSSDNASLPTNPPTSTSILAQSASPHSRRWISDSAEDNKLSSYLRPRQHHLKRLNVNDYEYQGALQLWTSEVDLLVHHRQTC